MRCSGFGVMEAPYIDEEIVFETDSEDEAITESKKLRNINNTPEQIKSSWVPNTYWVHVNTSTEKGKELLDIFEKEVEERLKKIQSQSNYKKIEIDGITIHTTTDDTLFDNPTKISGQTMGEVMWNGKEWVPKTNATQSSSFMFLDLTKTPKK